MDSHAVKLRHLPSHQDQRPSLPVARHHRLRLLLLPPQPPPRPRCRLHSQSRAPAPRNRAISTGERPESGPARTLLPHSTSRHSKTPNPSNSPSPGSLPPSPPARSIPYRPAASSTPSRSPVATSEHSLPHPRPADDLTTLASRVVRTRNGQTLAAPGEGNGVPSPSDRRKTLLERMIEEFGPPTPLPPDPATPPNEYFIRNLSAMNILQCKQTRKQIDFIHLGNKSFIMSIMTVTD